MCLFVRRCADFDAATTSSKHGSKRVRVRAAPFEPSSPVARELSGVGVGFAQHSHDGMHADGSNLQGMSPASNLPGQQHHVHGPSASFAVAWTEDGSPMSARSMV